MRGLIIVVTMAFVLGLLVSQVTGIVNDQSSTIDKLSPTGHVTEDQIRIYPDYVVLDIPGAQWSTFTDTNSMDPLLDEGTHALQFIPESSEDISVGDIISYVREGEEYRIIHRVVYKDVDDEGVYFIVKGDNNREPDPGKVRFEQIERVLFAVVY